MKLKNSCALLAIFVCMPLFLFSQDKKDDKWKKREVGLQLVGLDNFDFDFLYKQQVGENAFRRINVGFARLDLRDVGDDGGGTFNLGISIAREKRIPLTDKMNLVQAPGWLFNTALASNGDNTIANFSTGLSFVLGVHYQLSDHFYIGAEVFPSILMGFTITEDGFNDLDFTASFTTQNVGVSVVYKFEKK